MVLRCHRRDMRMAACLLLGRAIGRCEAAAAAVLVDGGAADHDRVLCRGVAVQEEAVQHIVLHRLKEMHLHSETKHGTETGCG